MVIGLLPYLYLPWAAGRDPYLNWGNPETKENFQRHVLRQQYGDDSMHEPRTLERAWGHAKQLTQWNRQQYTTFAIPFIFIGLVWLWFKERKFFYFTLGLFLVNTLGLAELLNFNFQRVELFCCRVFFLQAYVITAIWLALGVYALTQWLRKIIQHPKFEIVVGSVLMSLMVVVVLISNFQHNNMRQYFYAEDHARNILSSLEDNALIFPSGDHNTFPLIYLHHVEQVRPDILIGDKYGYIEYDLYQEMPNAPKRIRTRQQREEIETWLIKNSGRPVYYTVKPRLHLLPGYRAESYGMLFRICGPEEKMPERPLPQYTYRNLPDNHSVQDHAATVIPVATVVSSDSSSKCFLSAKLLIDKLDGYIGCIATQITT